MTGATRTAVTGSAPVAMLDDRSAHVNVRSAWLPATLILLSGTYAVFAFPAHHDIAWLLHMSARAIDGARLYVDVVDPNPSLIVALGIPAELVARATGIWDVAIFRLFVLGISSLALTDRLLAGVSDLPAAARNTLLAVAAYALILLDSMQSGQRDHLALALVLPWVVTVAARASRTPLAQRTAALAGGMGAIGLALKPHYAAVWLLLEVMLVIMARGRTTRVGPQQSLVGATIGRTEHRVLIACIAIYVMAVLLFTPAYLETARLAARTYLGYAGTDRLTLLLHLPVSRTVVIAAAVAWLMPPWGSASARLRQMLAVTALGFLAAIIAQGKGWTYHWVPANGFAQDLDDGALDDLVLQRGNTEQPLPPVRLRDVRSPNRLRTVRSPRQPSGQILQIALQFPSIVLPRLAIDACGCVTLQCVIRSTQPIHVVYVVQKRGEPLSPSYSCNSTCPLERAVRVSPALCPERVTLERHPLGQLASLHPLRSRFLGLVRWLLRYYQAVRLLTLVHHRRMS